MTTQDLIARAYAAFNHRDVDAAFELMSEQVSWPKASEGGRVVGKQAIREYWTSQWGQFDPHVDILEIVEREPGNADVKVRQLVKSLDGDVLSDTEVRHVYTVANGKIERTDIDPGDGHFDGPSPAFSAEPSSDATA